MRTRKSIENLVIIGIKGTVVALSAHTGEEVWRTHLKGSYFTTVSHQGGRVFAGTRGEMFCLDARTGRVLWHNPLKGMGFGIITIGDAPLAPPGAQLESDEAASHNAAAASPAATT